MDPEKAKQFVPEPSFYTYTPRDAIIYALGIGANTDQDLHYLYEGHTNFEVFPTFVVVPGLLAQSGQSLDWPGVDFDLSRVLHGEQYIELHGQLPPDGAQLRSETRVLDILDKGKAALIIKQVTTYDARTGQKLAVQEFSIFQSGSGGFGGNRTSSFERKSPAIPENPPDFVLTECVHPNQAALYRQGSGDLNPLHIDPEFAKMAGFPVPILHGLCSLGIAARLVLRAFGANQAKNLRSVKARFSAPVLPGQTLEVQMWKHSDQVVLFQAKVKETGKVAVSGGCIELNELVPVEIAPKDALKQQQILKSAAVFKRMAEELATPRDALKGVDAVIHYEIGCQGKPAVGKFTVELANGHGQVYEGEPRGGRKPTATVSIEDEDFVKLVGGQLDGTKAFLSGRLKVKGQLMLLQKLQTILARARQEVKSKL